MFYLFQFLECIYAKDYVNAAKLCKMSKYHETFIMSYSHTSISNYPIYIE
jgi:hypothetical protein